MPPLPADWSGQGYFTTAVGYPGLPGSFDLSDTYNQIDIPLLDPSFRLFGNPPPPPPNVRYKPYGACRGEIASMLVVAGNIAVQVGRAVATYGPKAAAIASRYVGPSAAFAVIFLLEIGVAVGPVGLVALLVSAGATLAAWWLYQECYANTGAFG